MISTDSNYQTTLRLYFNLQPVWRYLRLIKNISHFEFVFKVYEVFG